LLGASVQALGADGYIDGPWVYRRSGDQKIKRSARLVLHFRWQVERGEFLVCFVARHGEFASSLAEQR